jgi:type IV pilus assembly protein PilA
MMWAKKDKSGFTIVELLIVVVVIAILAAITIVAYNGIQNRAKKSSAISTAQSVLKKIEAYEAVVGSYPTTTGQLTAAAANNEPYSVTGVNFVYAFPSSAPSNENTIIITTCDSAQGNQIVYWDYEAKNIAVLNAGTVTPSSSCSIAQSS